MPEEEQKQMIYDVYTKKNYDEFLQVNNEIRKSAAENATPPIYNNGYKIADKIVDKMKKKAENARKEVARRRDNREGFSCNIM